MNKAKVYLITGFLGSGKTTLLKRILGWQKNISDTVILVNEFGEVGLDGALLSGAGSNVIELTSGCICCTLTADLLRCLSDIQDKFNPSQIIIESSGVADPAAVVTLLADSKLADFMAVEKVICVLDADYWDVRENFGSVFFSQLETANLILLNKIDLVESDRVQIFLREIHEEIAGSQIVPTIRCAIDPETLWSPSKLKAIGLHPMRLFKEFSLGDGKGQPSTDAGKGDVKHHLTTSATNNFVTFSYTESQSLDEKRFKLFVDELPWELFRMKGSVKFPDCQRLVNFVGGKSEWLPWDGEPQTRLAFIGWNVEPAQILEKLKDCMITDE